MVTIVNIANSIAGMKDCDLCRLDIQVNIETNETIGYAQFEDLSEYAIKTDGSFYFVGSSFKLKEGNNE